MGRQTRQVQAQSLQAVTFSEHARTTQQHWDAPLRIAIAAHLVPETYEVGEGVDWTNAYNQEP